MKLTIKSYSLNFYIATQKFKIKQVVIQIQITAVLDFSL